MRWFVSMILGVCLLVQACFLRGPDASGTLEGAGGARGVLAVLKDGSSWKAVASDTLGNVLALAGTNGDFTRRTFDPWGNPLVRDASGSLRASTLNERRADYEALPLAWASQEVDPDTGLTHYHFREYSPSLGGWLTQDPIGLAGGYLNLRSYLGNRPADELDVWGEIPALLVPVVGAAVGGVAGGLVSGGLEFLQTGDWDKTLEATKTGAIAGTAAGFTMTGGALIIGPAAAATTAGVVTLGVAGGASAQVAVNIATDRPMSEDILPAMAVGGLAGPVGRAVHKQLAPTTNRLWREMIKRPTARQAAESSAAKQSVAAAEGTQAHALERKAIEEAKKSPCPESVKGKVPLELGKQGKHIPDNNNYIPGRSPFTHNNPQGLLDDFAGKGQPVGDVPRGQPGFKERVDFGQVIGEVKGQPTTKGIIHYSKHGAHIVPANP